MFLLIHHGGSFLENELIVYEGEIVTKLKIDVGRWSYFELVAIKKNLGYWKIDTIWYTNLTFGMNILSDDKGALDIEGLL